MLTLRPVEGCRDCDTRESVVLDGYVRFLGPLVLKD